MYSYIIAIYKPHSNPKSNIYKRYTHKRKESEVTLKTIIKSQERRAKRRKGKQTTKNTPKTIDKMVISTLLLLFGH